LAAFIIEVGRLQHSVSCTEAMRVSGTQRQQDNANNMPLGIELGKRCFAVVFSSSPFASKTRHYSFEGAMYEL
jgi:hypothetical protein